MNPLRKHVIQVIKLGLVGLISLHLHLLLQGLDVILDILLHSSLPRGSVADVLLARETGGDFLP